MKSALVRRRAEQKAQEMTSAAAVYRVAIVLRQIDERIRANRWYRRLWRTVKR